MEITSKRWKAWMEPRYEEMATQIRAMPEPTPTPRPQYVLWITGGRTLFDGEMIGLADLDFVEGPNSWNIAVESIDEALELAPRITGCYDFGLAELANGEYREWWDKDGYQLGERMYKGEPRSDKLKEN